MDAEIIFLCKGLRNRSGEFGQSELECCPIIDQRGGDVGDIACRFIVGQIKGVQQIFFFFNESCGDLKNMKLAILNLDPVKN